MNKTDIVLIVQSCVIFILFVVVLTRKQPEPAIIDYERIKKGYEDNIKLISLKIDSIDKYNTTLIQKIDSIKQIIPNYKNTLINISKQIDSLNENYNNIDYYNSSDSAIISRLSR
jgi:peptidoglycan hydrolase CwlO-like protein